VISVAIGELGCPSLKYVYDMTWAEFCIRLFAYQRLDKKEWYKVRAIAYEIYLSRPLKVKHVNINKFMALDKEDKPKLTEAQRGAAKKAIELYQKQKNGAA
jgi:hypothetical protein